MLLFHLQGQKSLELYISKVRVLMAVCGNSHLLSTRNFFHICSPPEISFSSKFWGKAMQEVIFFFHTSGSPNTL